MFRERLHDAAIALHRILSAENIKFGIFGGYAIGVLGGFRTTKDIDCLVSATKERVVELLDNKMGFVWTKQVRQDYAAFLWDEPIRSNHPVLVEIFCEVFPGSVYSMEDVPYSVQPIQGRSLGLGVSAFLDPFYVFKGKLRAAASRSKFHDAVDMRVLETKFHAEIKSQAEKLSLETVGLAVQRHPELALLFRRLDVDLHEAMQAAKYTDPEEFANNPIGDVQRGLLE
ncbi:hypothetical protein GGR54DRAFT_636754 [Hypoxylon sp. NC1633]|nr:hypothetical protein GGR54DRAFT_636754 [Hypoxylon sp. NC1633]